MELLSLIAPKTSAWIAWAPNSIVHQFLSRALMDPDNAHVWGPPMKPWQFYSTMSWFLFSALKAIYQSVTGRTTYWCTYQWYGFDNCFPVDINALTKR